MAMPFDNYMNHATNGNSLTKVYRSRWGQKFYIPADWDVFVYFSPLKNADNSNTKSMSGLLKLRAVYYR